MCHPQQLLPPLSHDGARWCTVLYSTAKVPNFHRSRIGTIMRLVGNLCCFQAFLPSLVLIRSSRFVRITMNHFITHAIPQIGITVR